MNVTCIVLFVRETFFQRHPEYQQTKDGHAAPETERMQKFVNLHVQI